MVESELNNLYYSSNKNNTNYTIDIYSLTDNAWNILQTNHELIFWDKCLFKVYPFGSHNKCQCRSFRTRISTDYIWSVYELRYYFNLELVDVLRHILLHWNNLERFQWLGTKTIYRKFDEEPVPKLNLTADMFSAKYLRIFDLDDTPIGYVDDAIKNWQLLTYFESHENDGFRELPQTFNQLKELKYFAFSWRNIDIEKFPQQLCELKKLRFIRIQNTNIASIPFCITKLDEIESLMFISNTHLKNFPLDMFTMNKLWKLQILASTVDVKSLMEYNGFGDDDEKEFDVAFNYKKENNLVSYWLQATSLCYDYHNNRISSNLTNLLSFISDTGCCDLVCDSHYELDHIYCPADIYHDGVCNEACNKKPCHFDGGDCNQLCPCNHLELGNGVCNISCNTTYCEWDKYDCLPSKYNETLCELTYIEHGCNVLWVGDEFCDANCKDSRECGNDLNDCQVCEDNLCAAAYILVNLAANSQTNDDLVSLDELCTYWDTIINYAEAINKRMLWKNCSEAMNKMDIKKDNQLSFYEILAGTAEWNGITATQAKQLDCSFCTQKGKYY